jgi:hypothetical protein
MARWLVADGCSHQSGGVVDVGSLTKETRKEGKARETWQQPEPLRRSKQLLRDSTTGSPWAITTRKQVPLEKQLKEICHRVRMQSGRLHTSASFDGFSPQLLHNSIQPHAGEMAPDFSMSPIQTDNASRRPFENSLLHDRSPLGTPLWPGWMLRPL